MAFRLRPNWIESSVFVLVIAGLLVLSSTRQINFDETLALHSGWLYISGLNTDLNFLMPVVLLMGIPAVLVHDPAIVLVGLRIAVLLSVALVYLFVALRLRLTAFSAALWILLSIANGAFLAHAIEFRYDWAILVAWLLGFAFIVHFGARSPLVLGVLCGWLALHHLKGVYFSLWLYLFVLIAIGLHKEARLKNFIQLNAGIILAGSAWGLALYVAGRQHEAFSLYLQFQSLTKELQFEHRFVQIQARLIDDLWWWLLSGLLLGYGFVTRRINYAIAWSLAFAIVPAVFILLHPLPWAYMVTPVIPFLALCMSLIATEFSDSLSTHGVRERILAVVLIVTAASCVKENLITYSYGTLFRTAEVLRVLKLNLSPGDKIVDPAGVAYFVPPPDPEWYTDTLFRALAREGLWQRNYADSAETVAWHFNSYRVDWLPNDFSSGARKSTIPVCGPLRIRQGHDRQLTIPEKCAGIPNRMQSLW